MKLKQRIRTLITFTSLGLLGLSLLILTTGCQPMTPSEQTLQIQSAADGGDPSELPVIDDVYDRSVETDVYGTDLLKLP